MTLYFQFQFSRGSYTLDAIERNGSSIKKEGGGSGKKRK